MNQVENFAKEKGINKITLITINDNLKSAKVLSKKRASY